ncbi:M48 family metallopeptidase [Pelagibaculum spongiae]|uniref:Peptidase n=1 Tax=Pelagibaculum spongiae TaxID=2080658 RepID=A0A2V1GRG9_9GAMM|nr:M48 family metallopeptidase [Pelagibaculum spongiae]PVZ63899.1 peptidase [Pelagibaculum spongiae]
MLKFPKIALAVAVVTATVMLTSCATSPTGRKQFKLYSSQQLAEIATAQFRQMKQQQPINNAAKDNQYVQCIADKLIAQLPLPWSRQSWEVVVFESDDVNAFAMPGNKIGVYDGMINLAENQHQLAAVIGHELAHVLADHSNERLSSQSLIGFGVKIAEKQGGKSLAQGVGTAANLLIALPYSRVNETEADIIGLDIMAKAGFQPQQSVRLWQLMSQKSGGKSVPELLSTHPTDKSRIADLQKQMNQATALYRQAKTQGYAPHCKKP